LHLSPLFSTSCKYYTVNRCAVVLEVWKKVDKNGIFVWPLNCLTRSIARSFRLVAYNRFTLNELRLFWLDYVFTVCFVKFTRPAHSNFDPIRNSGLGGVTFELAPKLLIIRSSVSNLTLLFARSYYVHQTSPDRQRFMHRV